MYIHVRIPLKEASPLIQESQEIPQIAMYRVGGGGGMCTPDSDDVGCQMFHAFARAPLPLSRMGQMYV